MIHGTKLKYNKTLIERKLPPRQVWVAWNRLAMRETLYSRLLKNEKNNTNCSLYHHRLIQNTLLQSDVTCLAMCLTNGLANRQTNDDDYKTIAGSGTIFLLSSYYHPAVVRVNDFNIYDATDEQQVRKYRNDIITFATWL